jgi:hypothetical protein
MCPLPSVPGNHDNAGRQIHADLSPVLANQGTRSFTGWSQGPPAKCATSNENSSRVDAFRKFSFLCGFPIQR